MDVLECLEDLEKKNYIDTAHAEEIAKDYQKLLQKKHDVKSGFLSTESELLFLQYLSKDPEAWSSVIKTDSGCQDSRNARREAKQQLDDEKEKISEICEAVTAEIDKMKSNIDKLKEKLVQFENKKAELERLQGDAEDVPADSPIHQYHSAIQQLETVISEQNQKLSERDAAVQSMKSQLENKADEAQEKSHLQVDRLQSILSFIDTQDGLKVEITDTDKITVQFVSGPSDLNLTLTLTIHEDCHGNTRLKDVKSNADNFNISQLVKDSIEENDIPYLINTVRQLWQHHFPLLSEIDYLIKHHAVDWIQEKHLLRVLVGNGKLMFTLKVPEDYPTTRDINLVDVYGIEGMETENLPPPTASLRTWVTHLEEKFENQ